MKAKTTERRILRVNAQIRAEDGAEGAGPVAKGYAAKFNSDSEDLGGFVEFIRPGCFAKAIEECDIRALIDHNPSKILGRNKVGTLRLTEDEIGLAFEDDLPDTGYARDLVVSMNRGDVDQCSFGFVAVEEAWHQDGDIIRRELIRVQLFDVSIVTFPAYHDTEVALRGLAAYRSSKETPQPPANPTPRRDAAKRWLLANAVR